MALERIRSLWPVSGREFEPADPDPSGLGGGLGFTVPTEMGMRQDDQEYWDDPIDPGDTLQARSAGMGTLTWDTTDHAVATIDANGLITAVATGTCQATVVDSAGQTATSGNIIVT